MFLVSEAGVTLSRAEELNSRYCHLGPSCSFDLGYRYVFVIMHLTQSPPVSAHPFRFIV